MSPNPASSACVSCSMRTNALTGSEKSLEIANIANPWTKWSAAVARFQRRMRRKRRAPPRSPGGGDRLLTPRASTALGSPKSRSYSLCRA